MSREIKHRLWDRELKRYVYVEGLFNRLPGGFEDLDEPVSFSGLIDKNGVEIYEGDIVEIKVRAWIPAISKYVYNEQYVDDYFIGIESSGLCVYEMADILMDHEPVATYVTDAVFEMFTGVIDDNGVNVYGGDIVEIEEMPASPDTVEYTSLVVFSHGSFIVQCDGHVPMCAFQYRCPNGYAPMKLEVIGNIHQNPELLDK